MVSNGVLEQINADDYVQTDRRRTDGRTDGRRTDRQTDRQTDSRIIIASSVERMTLLWSCRLSSILIASQLPHTYTDEDTQLLAVTDRQTDRQTDSRIIAITSAVESDLVMKLKGVIHLDCVPVTTHIHWWRYTITGRHRQTDRQTDSRIIAITSAVEIDLVMKLQGVIHLDCVPVTKTKLIDATQ